MRRVSCDCDLLLGVLNGFLDCTLHMNAALGIVLSDPLQSLVDSAALGRRSTLALAALGPNTAIFNAVFQLSSFLGIATTNLVATNSISIDGLALEQRENRRMEASAALGTAILLGLVLGSGAAAVLLFFGRSWLAALKTDPSVMPLAEKYLSIRAFAMPAVLVMNACQGACLGNQDTKTPMLLFALATGLNIVGTIYLIWVRGMGVAAAAMSTVAAQYFAAALFLIKLNSPPKTKQDGFIRPSWPQGMYVKKTLRTYARVAGTLVTRTAVGMIAYFAMAFAANCLGPAGAAAHQIALQIFWFLSFFPEPLSMAAQTLIAKERSHPKAARAWARLLVCTGFGLGMFLAAVLALAFLSGPVLFTTDVVVQDLVRSLTPYGSISMMVCGVMMMFDGVSIGADSFRHLPASVGVAMVVTVGTLWLGYQYGTGLRGVWLALIAFYAMRLCGHLVFYASTRRNNVFFRGL